MKIRTNFIIIKLNILAHNFLVKFNQIQGKTLFLIFKAKHINIHCPSPSKKKKKRIKH